MIERIRRLLFSGSFFVIENTVPIFLSSGKKEGHENSGKALAVRTAGAFCHTSDRCIYPMEVCI